MSLDRDEIFRDDFPTARKGYDPEAVRAHLRAIADAVRESVDAARDRTSTPLAETAADRVGSIIEAAERKATEIEADARGEAERIASAARAEAKEQVDRAQGAVARLVEQADDLRSAVGKLGSEISSQVSSKSQPPPASPQAETTPEVVPEPPPIPEPPPREPEPQPPLIPEPQPPPSPVPEPPSVLEPQPPGPEIRAGSPSTQDLIAQLRGGADASAAAATTSNGEESDVAAARLVAMKMALEGASRDEIGRHLDDNYALAHPDKLLDDVLARAKA